MNTFKINKKVAFDRVSKIDKEKYPILSEICAMIYNEGYIQALNDYGIWKDGIQTIGCIQTPIKDIIKEIEDGKF